MDARSTDTTKLKAEALPTEMPESVLRGDGFDEELFMLCRDDDYLGIYRVLVQRYREILRLKGEK
jgi:hypothetical protein